MEGAQYLGKILVIIGFFIIMMGVIFLIGGKIPWFGRLPGDIVIEKKNFSVYVPITTSLLISILLTLFFWFLANKK